MQDQNSSDICYPITDIDDVLKWKCDGRCWIHKYTVETINETSSFKNSGYALDIRSKSNVFSEYKWSSGLLPKTIFCHDYKGGYVEDKYCKGVSNINTYRFFNWAGIDIFIYFSHHLVSVPPQGWLNAGHVHGVPVLGTLITEWRDGEQIWRKILTDNNKINIFAQKLAEICAHFKFDGYLLNIENVIPKEFVPRLIQFVALLKANLDLYCGTKTWLIWYDSVTTEGELAWQNKLCLLNKPFFDVCDGIFLNYVWTLADLLESISVAGTRRFDVFVGVDVFGRNCYQDGGFSVDKALAVIRSQNMSLALFAPGWSFERLPLGEQFLPREILFWKKFWPYLYIHGPAKLPFCTNFCQGVCFSKEGGEPLFNLGLQQYQPTCQACSDDPVSEDSCVSLCLNQGILSNGACLRLTQGHPGHSQLFHRVFACDFRAAKDKPLLLQISLSLKNNSASPASMFRIYFILEDQISVEGKKSVSMKKRPKGYRAGTQFGNLIISGSVVDFTAERQTNEPKIKFLGNNMLQSNAYDWQEFKFLLEVNAAASLTEILILPPPKGSIFWGLLEIKESEECATTRDIVASESTVREEN